MRPAVFIITANLLAFALGVMVTLWLIRFDAPVVPQEVARIGGIGPATKGASQGSASPAGVASQTGLASAVTPSEVGALSKVAALPPVSIVSDAPSGATGASTTDGSPTSQALPPTTLALADATTALADPSYMLQVAAFQNPANADRFKAVLAKDGFAANVVQGKAGGKVWQLVRVGSFADRSSAVAAVAALRRVTGLDAQVTKSVVQ
jgi:cell division septation protein DedD